MLEFEEGEEISPTEWQRILAELRQKQEEEKPADDETKKPPPAS
jgi:hypothetical protein